VARLLVLPTVFAIMQRRAPNRSASLDPLDPESPQFQPHHQAVTHSA
jgi:hypothetical protein